MSRSLIDTNQPVKCEVAVEGGSRSPSRTSGTDLGTRGGVCPALPTGYLSHAALTLGKPVFSANLMSAPCRRHWAESRKTNTNRR